MIQISQSKFTYAVVTLTVVVGMLYLVVASEEAANAVAEQAAVFEAIFFAVSGIAYIAVGIWMIKSNSQNKYPYIITLIGSLALIIFYFISRSVSLPIVGQQEDVGAIDITAKILQLAIIALSIYIISVGRTISESNIRP